MNHPNDGARTIPIVPAEPDTGTRMAQVTRLELPATALVHSYDHQVRVDP